MTYQIIQIGKKYAIYLPREIAREMGIKEGDRLITKVKVLILYCVINIIKQVF